MWSRHSICSIEGDILIQNIQPPNRGDDDYLIPTLLCLKQKVDRVFGSQPIATLSQEREGVDVHTCGDENGREQVRAYLQQALYVEEKGEMYSQQKQKQQQQQQQQQQQCSQQDNPNLSASTTVSTPASSQTQSRVLERPEISSPMVMNTPTSILPSPSDLVSCTPYNPALASSSPFPIPIPIPIPIPSSSITLGQSLPPNPVVTSNEYQDNQSPSGNHLSTPNSIPNQPSSLGQQPQPQQLPSSLHSLSQPQQQASLFSSPFPSLPSNTPFHRYHYIVKPPPRNQQSIDAILAEYHQPPAYYNPVTLGKEFNSMEMLYKYGIVSSSSSLQGTDSSNRLKFWKQLLSQQTEMEENKSVFRRYHYALNPPNLPSSSSSSSKTKAALFTSISSSSLFYPYSNVSCSYIGGWFID